jgi:membrane associated rhomboid family serine protease
MMRRWPIANWVIIGFTVAFSILADYAFPEQVASRLALWNRDVGEFIEEVKRAVAPETEGVSEGDDENETPEVIEKDENAEPSDAREVARFIVSQLDEDERKELLDELGAWGFHIHQLLTHALLHAGLWHLFGNMIFLWVFGNAVNAKLGNAAYCGLYAAFALLAGLAWLVSPGEGMLLVGASGAIMGVAGMFAVLYPLNEISIFGILLFRPFVLHMRAIWLLLIYLALDLLGFLSPGSDVAHISHVTGMLVGVGTAAGLLLSARLKPVDGEQTLLEMMGVKLQRITFRKSAPSVSWRDNVARTVEPPKQDGKKPPRSGRASGPGSPPCS